MGFPFEIRELKNASESHGSQELKSEEFLKQKCEGGSAGPKVDWFIAIFARPLWRLAPTPPHPGNQKTPRI